MLDLKEVELSLKDVELERQKVQLREKDERMIKILEDSQAMVQVCLCVHAVCVCECVYYYCCVQLWEKGY